VIQLFGRRANKHIGAEMMLPGFFGDHSQGESGGLTCAGKSVEYIQRTSAQMLLCLCEQLVEDLFRDGLVHFTPVYVFFRGGFFYEIFVVRGTSGKLTGIDGHGSLRSQKSLAVLFFMFEDFVVAEVPVNGRSVFNIQ